MPGVILFYWTLFYRIVIVPQGELLTKFDGQASASALLKSTISLRDWPLLITILNFSPIQNHSFDQYQQARIHCFLSTQQLACSHIAPGNRNITEWL